MIRDRQIIRDYLAAADRNSHYILRNLHLHCSSLQMEAAGSTEEFLLADIVIHQEKILHINIAGDRSPFKNSPDLATFDMAGAIALPGFVDCHTHLDKGHILPRTPTANGSFATALSATKADRETHWSADDLLRRMNFSIECAYHHGTFALRTHVDSQPQQAKISWPVFDELRQQWQGRMILQASSLFGIDFARDTDFLDQTAQRVAISGGRLGAVAFPVPDLEILLERLFVSAQHYGLDVDFHADESADPNDNALEKIASVALRTGFSNKILVGHCCSLAIQPSAQIQDTLSKVSDANLGIVALPYCNLYLQDRRFDATTPRWRGMTLLHEMKQRGIEVALGSDNTRDPFHAYGDLDMLDTFRLGTRVLHLDHGEQDWVKAVTQTPARMMRLEGLGKLDAGGPASFILFEGRSWSELLSRPESDRIVVRNGSALRTRLPAYAQLDAAIGPI